MTFGFLESGGGSGRLETGWPPPDYIGVACRGDLGLYYWTRSNYSKQPAKSNYSNRHSCRNEGFWPLPTVSGFARRAGIRRQSSLPSFNWTSCMSSEAAGFFLTDFCADECQNRKKLDGDLEKKVEKYLQVRRRRLRLRLCRWSCRRVLVSGGLRSRFLRGGCARGFLGEFGSGFCRRRSACSRG